MTIADPAAKDENVALRLTGGLMLAAAASTIVLMSHHPANTHEMVGLGYWIHPAMMVALTALFCGFAQVWRESGPRTLPILSGMVAYGIALGSHIGAATISGLIVPALAAQGHGGVSADIFALTWASNQALAGLGVAATGCAYLLWSLHLLRQPGLARALGLVALVTGIAPMMALAMGWLTMDLHGALIIYSSHAALPGLFGIALLSGRYPSR